jgi:hypothetical protein
VGTLLHAAHGVIIGVGAIAVLSVLLPVSSRRQARRLSRLREDAAAETLVLRAEERAAAELAEHPAETSADGWARPSRWLVAASLTSVAAAVIHGAVGPEHFREALRLGLFFVVICAAELALAALILRRPSLHVVALAGTVNVLTVVLWAITRTVGLPFELAEIEPVGVLDVLASSVELISAACSLAWIVQNRSTLITRPISIRVPAVMGGLMAGRLSHRQRGV